MPRALVYYRPTSALSSSENREKDEKGGDGIENGRAA
jgi:hypothetical protein